MEKDGIAGGDTQGTQARRYVSAIVVMGHPLSLVPTLSQG